MSHKIKKSGEKDEHDVMAIKTNGAEVALWIELCSFRKLKANISAAEA